MPELITRIDELNFGPCRNCAGEAPSRRDGDAACLITAADSGEGTILDRDLSRTGRAVSGGQGRIRIRVLINRISTAGQKREDEHELGKSLQSHKINRA